jgi:hypothetical protein
VLTTIFNLIFWLDERAMAIVPKILGALYVALILFGRPYRYHQVGSTTLWRLVCLHWPAKGAPSLSSTRYFVLIPMCSLASNVNLRLCTGSRAGSPARPGARADLS